MISKLVICVGVACFIDALIGYGLGLIFPAGVTAVLALSVGIIGGGLAFLVAERWDARRKY